MQTVKSFLEKARSGEINILENTYKILDEAEKINKDYNYFNVISKNLALQQAEDLSKKSPEDFPLYGLPVSVKDNICVKGIESAAGSKILKGYKPLFNATAIQKLVNAGAIIIGKTSQDEFGFGSFNTNTGLGFNVPKNPFDKNRVCGGSSGGSAGITQKMPLAHISIGESTGGSIVNPAALTGVVGLCPTYSRVSRYGLIDYANSLDKIGPLAKTIYGAAIALKTISGHDKNDSTSSPNPAEDYPSYIDKSAKGMRIGIIKESLEGLDKRIEKSLWDSVNILEKNNVSHSFVSLPLTMKYGTYAYYIIATAEASTNLAKFSGLRYGAQESTTLSFNDYFSKIRSSNLGREAKRRIIIGTFARMSGFRDAYYIKAMKIRTMIINEYKKLFKKYDALISPTVPFKALTFDEIKKLSPLQIYLMDNLTIGPNLAGLPHISIPSFNSELPDSTMLIANHFNEKSLITLSSKIEKEREKN